MSALSMDPRTGTFSGALDLGYLDEAPVRDGIVRGNIYELLAGARLSQDTVRAGRYRGPRLIRLPAIEVL